MSQIDRIGPTRRPDGTNDGTQSWRDLLFLHWRLPAAVLRAQVPAALELDLYRGEAFVGLVPFEMQATRTRWMPRTLGMDFLETNLRTYVTYDDRPGVYFFSLEAASWLAVKAARIGWSLPYHHASMRSEREGERVRYETVRHGDQDADLRVRYRIGSPVGPSEPGGLQHFLLERYLLFAIRRGRVLEGQVSHPPYTAFAAEIEELQQSLTTAAGLPACASRPDLVHFSPGVDVEVFGPADRGPA